MPATNINAKVAKNTFEPAMYSKEELEFFLSNVEKPPIVALNKPVPAGVNKGTVQVCLEELYGLQQLKEHEGQEWGFPLSDDTDERGYGAIKDSILRYLAWMERVDLIRDRSGRQIGNPSMFAWDSMGGAYKYGIESDGGIVRTEILTDGSRRPFGVKLKDRGQRAMKHLSEVAPWVAQSKQAVLDDRLVVKEEATQTHGSLTCSICGKTESFQRGNLQAYSLARTRMRKHLKSETTEAARHKLLHRTTFEAPSARV